MIAINTWVLSDRMRAAPRWNRDKRKSHAPRLLATPATHFLLYMYSDVSHTSDGPVVKQRRCDFFNCGRHFLLNDGDPHPLRVIR